MLSFRDSQQTRRYFDHSGSSSSISGLEIPSFQTFSNSSLKYVTKPLPPVPRRASSVYSEEEKIIDSYAMPSDADLPTLPQTFYSQPKPHSLSTSQLPLEAPQKFDFYAQKKHSSALLKTHAQSSPAPLVREHNGHCSEYWNPGQREALRAFPDEFSKREYRLAQREKALQLSRSYHSLINPPRRSESPPNVKAVPYDDGEKQHYTRRPKEAPVSPRRPQRSLPSRESTTKDSQMSFFDFESEDESPLPGRRETLANRLRNSKASFMNVDPKNAGSIVQNSAKLSKMLNPTNLRQDPMDRWSRRQGRRFTAAYPEKSKSTMELSLDPYTRRRYPAAEEEDDWDGRPHPQRLSMAMHQSKDRIASVLHNGGQHMREVIESSWERVANTKAQRRKARLKKSIRVVDGIPPYVTEPGYYL
ncbi:MAG: hypothetical protein M1819_002539 [Sarea resinae]|nr:MAG: hypothetical protein M1819_002539 [Sarea resinae]